MFEQFLAVVGELLREYFNLNLGIGFLERISQSIVIILILWILHGIALRFVNRRFRQDPRLLYNWRKLIQYISVIIGLILVGRIWLQGVDTVVTYLGLVSAGLAIALQDPIISLVGWLFIVWRRPFAVGDRIEVNEILGDVIDLRVFSFSLLEVGQRIDAEQSTGRIVHIPNNVVFKLPIVNTHQGYPYVWHEIPVMVTFESDWEKSKSILKNIIGEMAPDVSKGVREYEERASRFVITYGNIKPTVYTRVADSGVVLTMRYLIDPRRIRGSEQEIWEAILRTFKLHYDIDFAYPTQREYFHFEEGKKPPPPQEAPTVVSKKSWMKKETGYRPLHEEE